MNVNFQQVAMNIEEPNAIEARTVLAHNAPDPLVFREFAPDLDDFQVLNYILTLSPARDKKSLADSLLNYFGSLRNVLEARPEQLMCVQGIGEKTANLITSFIPVMKAWQRRTNDNPVCIKNSIEAAKYCKSLLYGSRNEQFWIVCLNAQCKVLGKRRVSEGSLSEVSAYPRIVMEAALNYNAHSVLLTHNHPGGTVAPSAEDISSTLLLQRLLDGVGILVLDHIIIADDNAYSMIQHGDIDYRIRSK